MWHKTLSTIGNCYCTAKWRVDRAQCDLQQSVSGHICHCVHCTGDAARSTIAGLSWDTLWSRIRGCCRRAKGEFRIRSVWRRRKTSIGFRTMPTAFVPTGLLLLLLRYGVQESCQSEKLPSRWSERFVRYGNDINNGTVKRNVWPSYDDPIKQRYRR